jgi:hypothetical protein
MRLFVDRDTFRPQDILTLFGDRYRPNRGEKFLMHLYITNYAMTVAKNRADARTEATRY